MRLNPWCATGKNRASKLPKPVRRYLIDRFHLSPEYLDTLRCFEGRKYVDGRLIRNVQVFCPAMVLEQRLVLKSPYDLERHPEFLLYEGEIDGNGSIYLSDRIWRTRRPAYHDSDDVPEKKSKTIWF